MLYLAAVVRLFYLSAENESWLFGFLAAMLVAVPIAAMAVYSNGDDGRLCLRGHQEYVRVSNGKTSHVEKRWVCEQFAIEVP